MVSRRTNFGERSEPAPDRGGKLQSAGGRLKVMSRHCQSLLLKLLVSYACTICIERSSTE